MKTEEKIKEKLKVSANLAENQTYYLKHQNQSYEDDKKDKIKKSECPYGGIDCAWCTEECEG